MQAYIGNASLDTLRGGVVPWWSDNTGTHTLQPQPSLENSMMSRGQSPWIRDAKRRWNNINTEIDRVNSH